MSLYHAPPLPLLPSHFSLDGNDSGRALYTPLTCAVGGQVVEHLPSSTKSLYSIAQYKIFLLVVATTFVVCAITYTRSSLSLWFQLSKKQCDPRRAARHPLTIPYSIPFLCNSIQLGWDTAGFLDGIMRRYAYDAPLRVRTIILDFCIVTKPDHIQTLFKDSKWVGSKPGTLFVLGQVFNTPRKVLPLYAADDSGMATKARQGSKTRQEDRIHYWQAHLGQRYMSGQHLQTTSERYLQILREDLDKLDIGNKWVEIPDLYRLLQMHVSRATVKTLMGTAILEQYPTLVEDFWEFDRNFSNYTRALPRWWVPKAYAVRDRLLAGIAKWTQYANVKSDCSHLGQEDPDWDPHFGSKLMKAREHAYQKMTGMNLGGRASETLGLIFASNANTVPSIFWFITEALRDPELMNNMLAESATCNKSDGTIDINKLNEQPFVQSACAEVLRLRVAISMVRSNEFKDVHLGEYRIPKQMTMLLFSRMAALNRDAWAVVRPSTLGRPLEEFWAERFLVQVESSSTSNNQSAPSAAAKTERQFSLDGLAGCWIPFGGGQRMCPGRHFAKHEIIGTFALMFQMFDIEVVNAQQAKTLEPDLRWAPYGGLPPAGQLQVRMRRRI